MLNLPLNTVRLLLLLSFTVLCTAVLTGVIGEKPFHYTTHSGKLPTQNNTLFHQVGDIPLPAGFRRVSADTTSFAYWLRALRLKSDRTVYLYNGARKANQSAQHAVIDIPIGDKDLQQCADAIMRLRAAYLLSTGREDEIRFFDNAGNLYRCPRKPSPGEFTNYLEKVYARCGTASLEKQMHRVRDPRQIEAGQVFIKGGSPGHAVIVLDVAINNRGERIFMLAQSYMPAQSVHILVNPAEKALSPWYLVSLENERLETPEWVFSFAQLKTW